MNDLKEKRDIILKSIKPICEAYGIKCDYIIENDPKNEILILDNQNINCTSNSIEAVADEVVGYIFVNIYSKRHYIGPYKIETLNAIQKYWVILNQETKEE